MAVAVREYMDFPYILKFIYYFYLFILLALCTTLTLPFTINLPKLGKTQMIQILRS